MKNNLLFANEHSQSELSAAKSQQWDYINNYLNRYVESIANYTRHLGPNSQWEEFPDFETRVLKQVVEFIAKEEFTLDELYYIFNYHGYWGHKKYENLENAKLDSIDFVMDEEDYDKEDFARLKSKIESINPIVFGIVLRLVIESNLFWDSEKEEFIHPTILKGLSKS